MWYEYAIPIGMMTAALVGCPTVSMVLQYYIWSGERRAVRMFCQKLDIGEPDEQSWNFLGVFP